MKKTLMLFTTCVCTSNAFADEGNYRRHSAPVNYSFYELGIGSTSGNDNFSSDVRWKLAMEGMLSANWILALKYDGGIQDYDRFDRYDNEAILGIKYRFGVTESSDIVLGAHGGYKFEYDDWDFFDDEYHGPIYGGSVEYRHGITQKWEIGGGYIGELVDEELRSRASIGTTYYFKTWLGLGIDITQDFDSSSTITFLNLKM
ncbi:hypothetical protein [Vibrio sp. WXL103]|uniref:hypothetical protein n=1 Tax=unclassified Vibrio TaxID=2614977 RepID=UPI003EC83E24